MVERTLAWLNRCRRLAKDWDKVMNLNVTAPFFLAREVGRRCMIPRKAGKIINVASIAGLRGLSSGVHTIA